MGDPFYTWFSDENVILVFAAIYLGFKLLYIVFTTAQWEMKMNQTHMELMSLQKTQRATSTKKKTNLYAARVPDATYGAPMSIT